MCPGGVRTGGPEALHQLVHELRRFGADAHISYFPFEKTFEVLDDYLEYDVSPAALADQDGSLVILPETLTALSETLRSATAAIWWLSVDNFYGPVNTTSAASGTLRQWAFKAGLRRSPPHQASFSKLKRALHFAQSMYAMDFLRSRKLQGRFLGDYLPC